MASSDLFKSLKDMTVIDLKILGKIIKADNIPEKFKKKEELAMPIRARLLELMEMDNIDPKEVMPDEKPKVCNLKIRMGGSGGITMVTNDVNLDWTVKEFRSKLAKGTLGKAGLMENEMLLYINNALMDDDGQTLKSYKVKDKSLIDIKKGTIKTTLDTALNIMLYSDPVNLQEKDNILLTGMKIYNVAYDVTETVLNFIKRVFKETTADKHNPWKTANDFVMVSRNSWQKPPFILLDNEKCMADSVKPMQDFVIISAFHLVNVIRKLSLISFTECVKRNLVKHGVLAEDGSYNEDYLARRNSKKAKDTPYSPVETYIKKLRASKKQDAFLDNSDSEEKVDDKIKEMAKELNIKTDIPAHKITNSSRKAFAEAEATDERRNVKKIKDALTLPTSSAPAMTNFNLLILDGQTDTMTNLTVNEETTIAEVKAMLEVKLEIPTKSQAIYKKKTDTEELKDSDLVGGNKVLYLKEVEEEEEGEEEEEEEEEEEDKEEEPEDEDKGKEGNKRLEGLKKVRDQYAKMGIIMDQDLF